MVNAAGRIPLRAASFRCLRSGAGTGPVSAGSGPGRPWCETGRSRSGPARVPTSHAARRTGGGWCADRIHRLGAGTRYGRGGQIMPIATVNPATGETLRTFEALGPDGIEERIAAAASAFRTYRTTDFDHRAALLNGAADLLDKERDEIARVMTTEMGKTLAAAKAEAAKCAKAMRWYAANAARLIADEHPGDA